MNSIFFPGNDIRYICKKSRWQTIFDRTTVFLNTGAEPDMRYPYIDMMVVISRKKWLLETWISKTWWTKTDFVPTLVQLLEAWLKHWPDLSRLVWHQNLYIELLTSRPSHHLIIGALAALDDWIEPNWDCGIKVQHLLVGAADDGSGWKNILPCTVMPLSRVQDYRRGPCWLSPWSTLLLKQGLVRIVEWRTSGKHSPVTNRWQETHKVILATLGQATSHQKSGRWFNSCAGLNWDCGYPPKWTLVRIFLAVRRGIPSPAPGACLQAAGSPKNLCHKDKTLWHFQF